MKTPKVIFIDIDGTLLNDEHQLSTRTIEAVKKIQIQTNIELVLATGRPPLGVKSIYEALNLTSPIICLNGSLVVRNPFENDFILNTTLSMSAVRKIRQLVEPMEISINYLHQYDWYCDQRDAWVVREEWILKSKVHPARSKDFLDKWRVQKTGPNKILFIGAPDQINHSYESLLAHFSAEEVSIVKTGANYIEIAANDVNKSKGVLSVLAEQEIDPTDSWAFGDNVNDIEMIASVGRGIWMSNSVSRLRSSSTYATTYSNHEDGLIRYLEDEGLFTES